MNWLLIGACILAIASLQAPPSHARTDIHSQRIQFARGTSSATIKGYAGRDYVVGARACQLMTVKPTTPHTANYFNVTRDGDTSIVTVGAGERYEIPDALVVGG